MQTLGNHIAGWHGHIESGALTPRLSELIILEMVTIATLLMERLCFYLSNFLSYCSEGNHMLYVT